MKTTHVQLALHPGTHLPYICLNGGPFADAQLTPAGARRLAQFLQNVARLAENRHTQHPGSAPTEFQIEVTQ